LIAGIVESDDPTGNEARIGRGDRTTTANPGGLAGQAPAVAAATGTSATTNTQATLSELTAAVPSALAGLATPSSLTEGLPGMETVLGLFGASWNSNGNGLTLTGPLGDALAGLTGSTTLTASTPINAFVRNSQPINTALGTGNTIFGLGNSLKPAASAAAGAVHAAQAAVAGSGLSSNRPQTNGTANTIPMPSTTPQSPPTDV